MTAPVPVLGFRRRLRASGEPYLHCITADRLVIEAGSELTLRRLHAGDLDSAEFALVVILPAGPWAPTAAERAAAAGDDLTGTAVRIDPRDGTEAAPW